jgi:hypothetical protein
VSNEEAVDRLYEAKDAIEAVLDDPDLGRVFHLPLEWAMAYISEIVTDIEDADS